jgi:hypothetical protein
LANAVARAEVRAFEQKAPEFCEVLKPYMRDLLAAGKATNLDQAYTMAFSTHPRLRALSPAAAKLADQRRAANASLSGAPHGGQPRPERKHKPGTFNDAVDDVREAIRQLS